jgi:hypothetical protein
MDIRGRRLPPGLSMHTFAFDILHRRSFRMIEDLEFLFDLMHDA